MPLNPAKYEIHEADDYGSALCSAIYSLCNRFNSAQVLERGRLTSWLERGGAEQYPALVRNDHTLVVDVDKERKDRIFEVLGHPQIGLKEGRDFIFLKPQDPKASPHDAGIIVVDLSRETTRQKILTAYLIGAQDAMMQAIDSSIAEEAHYIEPYQKKDETLLAAFRQAAYCFVGTAPASELLGLYQHPEGTKLPIPEAEIGAEHEYGLKALMRTIQTYSQDAGLNFDRGPLTEAQRISLAAFGISYAAQKLGLELPVEMKATFPRAPSTMWRRGGRAAYVLDGGSLNDLGAD